MINFQYTAASIHKEINMNIDSQVYEMSIPGILSLSKQYELTKDRARKNPLNKEPFLQGKVSDFYEQDLMMSECSSFSMKLFHFPLETYSMRP